MKTIGRVGEPERHETTGRGVDPEMPTP